MEYRQLGTAGPRVSALGLGTNNFGRKLDDPAAAAVLGAAIDAGVTFIDTADVYSAGASESQLGRLLGARRNDVVLATKFGLPFDEDPAHRGTSRAWIEQSVEASLGRLQTDHIDLYQVHRPDPSTPIEETLRALDDLVKAGKVRFVGLSNFDGAVLSDAMSEAERNGLTIPVSEQSEFSLLERSAEEHILPACAQLGLGFIPFFPLASGVLTGKYRDRQSAAALSGRITGTPREARLLTDANTDLMDRLAHFAEGFGKSLLDLAFAYLLTQPEVSTVIASASNPDQVRMNVSASEWRLGVPELTALRNTFESEAANPN